MADTDITAHSAGSLEALQNHAAHSRRVRPPDLDMATGAENRVPLRADAEKLARRESKLGLRNLFGRHRSTHYETEGTTSSSVRETAPSRSIRASLADIGNWPYNFHAAKSEITLPTIQQSAPRPLSTAVTAPTTSLAAKPKKNAPARSKTPTPTARPGRGSLATWDPPPLFQAYPQAIKHAQLPACTISADSLLRLHGSKGSSGLSSRDGLTPELGGGGGGGGGGDSAADKMAEKAKKKHRRNTSASSFKLDWTTKIYVLVTSGYLLQYSGEGSFDRLPEKILHVSKDSAAFASDLIPGRHWVLQVSSAMESDGTQAPDSRSLFSRLPFRGSERRHASTFLMVFESAEDMESWITTLRREIEHLGGKKHLSETGKPKMDDDVVQLRAQPSQRTLVVRDPDRFSRIISPDHLPWNHDPTSSSSSSAPDIHLEAPESESTPDQSVDDVSTTNSMVSHDGRQLDNLRDSANRLSFISSGQRTFVTSEGGSSPPCSPVRDSFLSQAEESPPYATTTTTDISLHEAAARPRPNAAAILDRRQSMQAMQPLGDFRIAQNAPPRPVSTYSTSWQEATHALASPPPTTIPNFSVPHSVGRRYSVTKSPPLESAPFAPAAAAQATARIPPARGARRPPPPSLGSSRPLSIVDDQPSPGATTARFFDSISDDYHHHRASVTTTTPAVRVSWEEPPPRTSSRMVDLDKPSSADDVTLTQIQLTVRTSPRRHASMQALRTTSDASSENRSDPIKFILPITKMPLPPLPPPPPPLPTMTISAFPSLDKDERQQQRSKSSLDTYERRARSRSPPPVSSSSSSSRRRRSSSYKRASMFTHASEVSADRHSMAAASVENLYLKELISLQHAAAAATTAKTGPLVPRPSASNQHLRVNSASKALFNRRSMPHLVEGPPPAPPPTCALPPLPPKPSSRPKSMKARNI